MKKITSWFSVFLVLFLTNCNRVKDDYKIKGSDLNVTGAASPVSAAAGISNIAGVNWADQRDNFVDGRLLLSGLSSSDNLTSVQAKSDIILAGFQNVGINTIRLPVNAATVLDTYWNIYSGSIDKAVSRGMKVILAYWEGNSSKDGFVDNTTQFWNMWQAIVTKYGNNPSLYFEVINEPHGYSLSALTTLYADWLNRFPAVPRGRIILGGTGFSQNVTGVGADNRLSSCLLALHNYTFFGNANMLTPASWENQMQNNIGNFASRTVVTEFGAEMTTNKNYTGAVNGDVSIAFIQGVTNKCKNSALSSVYWPGLRTADRYSLFTFNGTTMTLTNASGLSRLQLGWNQSGTGSGFDPNAFYRIVNRNSGKSLDINGASTANGATVVQHTSVTANNQQWRITDIGGGFFRITNRNSSEVLDVSGNSTANGVPVIQWPSTGGNNQQWGITDIGGGFFRITNRNSAEVLDVSGGSTADGASVIQWPSTGGNNQQWDIIKL
jgi:endoglucanase